MQLLPSILVPYDVFEEQSKKLHIRVPMLKNRCLAFYFTLKEMHILNAIGGCRNFFDEGDARACEGGLASGVGS